MTPAADSAGRLLEGARRKRMDAATAEATAAAAVIVDAAEPESAGRLAGAMDDPGIALLVIAAAEALRPAGQRERVETAARAVPTPDRALALGCSERYLARIDAA